jgi:hypothetical protein
MYIYWTYFITLVRGMQSSTAAKYPCLYTKHWGLLPYTVNDIFVSFHNGSCFPPLQLFKKIGYTSLHELLLVPFFPPHSLRHTPNNNSYYLGQYITLLMKCGTEKTSVRVAWVWLKHYCPNYVYSPEYLALRSYKNLALLMTDVNSVESTVCFHIFIFNSTKSFSASFSHHNLGRPIFLPYSGLF